MIKYILIIVMSIYPFTSSADEALDETILWNSPHWVAEEFQNSGLDKQYKLSSKINPFYLRGDFNGDKKTDIAILVEDIRTNKIGIAIFHYGESRSFIVSAGKKIGNGGDDFEWMDIWNVYRNQPIRQGAGEGKPPVINAEALDVGKSQSASAIIYWNGKNYEWYQQGD